MNFLKYTLASLALVLSMFIQSSTACPTPLEFQDFYIWKVGEFVHWDGEGDFHNGGNESLDASLWMQVQVLIPTSIRQPQPITLIQQQVKIQNPGQPVPDTWQVTNSIDNPTWSLNQLTGKLMVFGQNSLNKANLVGIQPGAKVWVRAYMEAGELYRNFNPAKDCDENGIEPTTGIPVVDPRHVTSFFWDGTTRLQ